MWATQQEIEEQWEAETIGVGLNDDLIDARSAEMDTEPQYGTDEWERDQRAYEAAEYEAELRGTWL